MRRTMLKSKIDRATVTQADLNHVGEQVCVDVDNGAAARLTAPGDIVVPIVYASLDEDEIGRVEPRFVFVDWDNRTMHLGSNRAA